MTTITPQTLPSVDSTLSWHSGYEYRWVRSTTGYEVYGLHYTSNGAYQQDIHDIRVDTSTNIWEDVGSNQPFIVTDGTTVTLANASGTSLYKFTKPTSASWISSGSGGGTSTEDVLVQDVKIVDYGGITGFRFEQRGYAAASYQLIGPATYNWTVTVASNNLQHHISQLAAGTYYLWSGGSQLATLSTPSRQKKVFCNFW